LKIKITSITSIFIACLLGFPSLSDLFSSEKNTWKIENIQLNNNCIAETYDCIPDPGDQNECNNMNLINSQPADYQLFAPFPNPFNPVIAIEYSLPYASNVLLVIYDLMGRQVDILYNDIQHPNNYTISWDASNYSSGVYFIKVNVGDSQSPISQSQKVVLLK